jgi:hypothetical protein
MVKVKTIDYFERKKSLNVLKQVFPQNFLGDLSGMWSNLKSGLNILGSISSNCEKFQNSWTTLDKSIFIDLMQLIVSVMDDKNPITVWRVVSLLIDLYRIVSKLGYHPRIPLHLDTPQSGLEPFLLSALSMFMPKNLFEILKRVSIFTTSKLCDDPSSIWEFLHYIGLFMNGLIGDISESNPMRKLLIYLMSNFSFLSHRRLIFLMGKLTKEWICDKRIVLSPHFRDQVKDLQIECNENVTLIELEKRSMHFKEVKNDFIRLVKCIKSYESTVRKEPVCFVLEGPPGCLKSVTMAKLVQALELDTYTHLVKPKDDGKDFYDSYNGEKCFVMDDVGQQSVSQWRGIINMISPIKLPLECASVDLKDTKFFDSDIVVLTTNNFSKMGGLLRDDGISDIKALWRRGNVFDFKNVVNNRGKLCGILEFKYFDLVAKDFVNDFPPDIRNYLKEMNINLATSIKIGVNGSCVEYLAWMKRIILVFDKVRNSQFSSNVLTSEEIEELRLVTAHSKDCCDYVMNFKNILSDVFVNVSDILTNVLGQFCASITLKNVKNILFSESAIIAAITISIGGILTWFLRDSICDTQSYLAYETVAQMFSRLEKKRSIAYKQSTAVEKISSQVYEISVDNNGTQVEVCGILSGHFLLTVAHAANVADVVVTVYKDKEKLDILLDKVPMQVVFRSVTNDVVVLKMPPKLLTPFKSLAKFFSLDDKGDQWMITPAGHIYLPPRMKKPSHEVFYEMSLGGELVYLRCKEPSTFGEEVPKALTYDFGTPGLCGSPIVTTNGKFKGMHVSGNAELTECHALLWNEEIIAKISNILNGDLEYFVDVDISDKVRTNNSSIKINVNAHIQTPKETNFGPSALYGVFEVEREPANLQFSGPHTVKDIEKKSFIPVKIVDQSEVVFATSIVEDYMSSFDDLEEAEVVSGTQLLAGLNRKSSNGFNCKDDKGVYINFENGTYTPLFKEELNILESKLDQGIDIKLEDVLWYATLKDELRNKSKMGKPRSFRVSRLHIQVLTKKYFGRLVEHLISHRQFNGIMVGINPFMEFKSMYAKLKECDGVWAGDIGSYDGNMLPQVQVALNNIVMKYYHGAHTNAAEFILTNMPYCYVGVNDDVFLTNHSMPSGSFLTAIFNSLVNKMYTAMWFKRCVTNTSHQDLKNLFHRNLIDYVYGDDKLNGVLTVHPNLNAVTMRNFFESIGMTFTDSLKGEITQKYQSLNEVTFLKRYFRYHPLLREITCPLDLVTLYSGLSWVDYSKDTNLVLLEKINNFQREIFLHWDIRERDVNILKNCCVNRNIQFTELPLNYLSKLYQENPNEFFSFLKEKFRYN